MTAVARDAYGLAVSTSSRPALDAYDRGVRALLGFGADTVERFRDAVLADPEFVLARAALAVALYPGRAHPRRARRDQCPIHSQARPESGTHLGRFQTRSQRSPAEAAEPRLKIGLGPP